MAATAAVLTVGLLKLIQLKLCELQIDVCFQCLGLIRLGWIIDFGQMSWMFHWFSNEADWRLSQDNQVWWLLAMVAQALKNQSHWYDWSFCWMSCLLSSDDHHQHSSFWSRSVMPSFTSTHLPSSTIPLYHSRYYQVHPSILLWSDSIPWSIDLYYSIICLHLNVLCFVDQSTLSNDQVLIWPVPCYARDYST